jgi:hypothetical protein
VGILHRFNTTFICKRTENIEKAGNEWIEFSDRIADMKNVACDSVDMRK